MAKKNNSIQNILDYQANYGAIPKDYMERLSWLYQEVRFTESDLFDLLDSLDELEQVQWNEINYIFYMTPKATPRPRAAFNSKPNTFHFYVGGAKYNKNIFEQFHKEHSNMECVISTPCSLDTRVYIQTPNGMSKKEKIAAELGVIHNVNAPDWDNLGKSYSDMVQDILISNDSIVFRGAVQKFYSVLPRIEVQLRFMTQYDCKYNKRTIEKRKSFYENDKTLKDIGYII